MKRIRPWSTWKVEYSNDTSDSIFDTVTVLKRVGKDNYFVIDGKEREMYMHYVCFIKQVTA